MTRFAKKFDAPLKLLAVFFVLALVGGCVTHRKAEALAGRYAFQQTEMGLPFQIVLFASSPQTAQAVAEAGFTRIAQLNSIFSDYDADSELSRLSQTSGSGQRVRVSQDLWNVLWAASEISRESGGAFDVTVGPLVSLWRKARREKQFPDPARLERARQATGYQMLEFYPQERAVELTGPRMLLDLGGIAKGYAMQEALKVLRQKGANRAMISGGGDMALGEPPPHEQGWRIQLTGVNLERQSAVVSLANCGFATSGDAFQFVEINGVRYSHIVDPHTGVGLTNHSQVVVIAPSPMEADVLSTTLSVLPLPAAQRLVSRHPEIAARILSSGEKGVQEFHTTNFKNYLLKK